MRNLNSEQKYEIGIVGLGVMGRNLLLKIADHGFSAEEGARHGASIMPGGLKEAYERIRPILEAVAARVNDEPCVTYLVPMSAGHFVKMVHNGIEYGLMQLISESYALMKQVLGFSEDELHTYERIDAKGTFYTEWQKG